jgi:hypothetical protein
MLVGIMNRIKIGVRLESLDLPFRKALAEAAGLGVAGVQFDPVGELSPTRLSQTRSPPPATFLQP